MAMIRKLDRIRRSVLAAFLSLAFLMVAQCQKAREPEPVAIVDTTQVVAPTPPERPIAILYSYTPIGLELREMVQKQSDTVWAGREVTYAYGPGPLVLANTGVGLANAAATTQWVIDRYNPTAILFCGIASAVNPAHHIGDLVIPEKYITFDYGYWGDKGLQTDSVTVGNPLAAGFTRMLEIPVDRDLWVRLGESANGAAFNLRAIARRLPEIHQGGIAISGNSFLDNKGKRDQLYKQLQAQITDTESAAAVQTAHAAGVPIAVLRACAAPVGESTTPQAQEQLADFFKVSAHNVALVLRQFLAQAR